MSPMIIDEVLAQPQDITRLPGPYSIFLYRYRLVRGAAGLRGTLVSASVSRSVRANLPVPRFNLRDCRAAGVNR